ncbi:MAG TPA: DegV family protein [Acidimicrobiales bacterium]|nr:DegV family protein [Acidimicrobiales bacterium]
MIGLCVDSNAQVPPELVDRYGLEVVPLSITVDGEEFLEGVDLDADAFYELYELYERSGEGAAPQVTTAAPSPGRFAQAYEALAARGATEILSVHIGSTISATLNAARVAAAGSPVPVRLVDTGTASFAVACCMWEAAEAVAAGAGLDEAAQLAEAVASRTDNVFTVGALDLARRGGRLGEAAAQELADAAIPVVRLIGGSYQPIAQVVTLEEAADVMAAAVLTGGTGLRVGISVADAAALPLREALEACLTGAPEVAELVRYRVGPSVGAHTGPGTAGAMWYPAGIATA